VSQESLCNPCIDKPETIQRVEVVRGNVAPPSAADVASRIKELGGELRDITHDCGISRTKSLGEIDFSTTACNWGGRYPALLFEPIGSAGEGSFVLLASNGSTLAVLFSEAPSASFVRIFSGLLKEDFDELFREISEPPTG
jgi:hypothetical protein